MASKDNGAETIIKLPKSSFTAFRLTYFTADFLSDLSKCILIGKLPAIWKDHTGPGFISLATHHSKALVKKNFRTAAATIHKSIRGLGMEIESSKEVEEGAFNIFLNKASRKGKSLLEVINDLEDSEDSSDSGSDSDSASGLVSRFNFDIENNSLKSLEPLHVTGESSTLSGFDVTTTKIPLIHWDRTHSGTGDSTDKQSTPENSRNSPKLNDKREHGIFDLFLKTNSVKHENLSFLDVPDEDIKTDPISIPSSQEAPHLSSQDEAPHLPISFVQEKIKHLTLPPGGAPGVKFNVASTGRSKMKLALPQPVDDVGSVVDDQRKHKRFRKRLNSIPSVPRKGLRSRKNDLRHKVYLEILKRYKPGEVLRADKILLLTKEVTSAKNVRSFSENEPVDSRIRERWKPYYAVLRRTDNANELLTLQFYELMRMSDNTKRTPAISFPLSKKVNAQFYSHSDKSISVIVPKENGVLIYILKYQSQNTAYRWLYFIRQTLGHALDETFHIDIPELSTTFHLKVPTRVIKESFIKKANILATEKDLGYRVNHSTVLEYLKLRIIDELEVNKVPGYEKWLENTSRPWFCFRLYDRIEWVVNNSELFYIQNQLLKDSFKLEFRDMCYMSNQTPISGKRTIKEPTSIEGFLSRLSNTNGHERSLWRSFHKVLYFYSCKNLLFFTKYYRAEPPISQGVEEELISTEGIYEHSPYPIDENHHITWLKDKDFELRDLAALTELERRSQQIIKAQALIDMTRIKEVRCVPLSKVTKMQRLLLSLLWYADPELVDDESIVDSAFEIEMINGAVMKLQAPNRNLRGEWIGRITELKDYWFLRKREELRLQILVRNENLKRLNINEYVDSNIVQEAESLEIKRSIADPKIHNIDSIAMSECVLMSGFLYQKSRKHSNFHKFYVVLCPGYLVLFTIFKRSVKKGTCKKTPVFEHYLTIPIADCYIYSGNATSLDLLERPLDSDPQFPTRHSLPRLYPNGWKSNDDELVCCFTLWLGKKRNIKGKERASSKYFADNKSGRNLKGSTEENPGLAKMIQKLGFTGKSIVFKATSRQERENWTYKLLAEIDRFSGT
jgi:hypothetical protein